MPSPVELPNVGGKISLPAIHQERVAALAASCEELGARIWTRDTGTGIKGIESAEVYDDDAIRYPGRASGVQRSVDACVHRKGDGQPAMGEEKPVPDRDARGARQRGGMKRGRIAVRDDEVGPELVQETAIRQESGGEAARESRPGLERVDLDAPDFAKHRERISARIQMNFMTLRAERRNQ
jgi:hypothetical protein